MKTPARILLVLALAAAAVKALDGTLAWDPVAPPVSGYKLFTGTNSGAYILTNDVGNATRGAFTNLTTGIWFFAVKAYADFGTNRLESRFSDEARLEIAPDAPQNLRILGKGQVSIQFTNPPPAAFIESSPDLKGPWSPWLYYQVLGPPAPAGLQAAIVPGQEKQFFRIAP